MARFHKFLSLLIIYASAYLLLAFDWDAVLNSIQAGNCGVCSSFLPIFRLLDQIQDMIVGDSLQLSDHTQYVLKMVSTLTIDIAIIPLSFHMVTLSIFLNITDHPLYIISSISPLSLINYSYIFVL
jgi:hypothetical protein